jgi:hypothetical protein
MGAESAKARHVERVVSSRALPTPSVAPSPVVDNAVGADRVKRVPFYSFGARRGGFPGFIPRHYLYIDSSRHR